MSAGELSRRQSNIILAVWLLGWAAACCLVIWVRLSGAATLSISGSATGNGTHLFQVAGDNLTAIWNGTAWNVTGALP
jgi:hypothetical protein